jgi:hypothetical protein
VNTHTLSLGIAIYIFVFIIAGILVSTLNEYISSGIPLVIFILIPSILYIFYHDEDKVIYINKSKFLILIVFLVFNFTKLQIKRLHNKSSFSDYLPIPETSVFAEKLYPGFQIDYLSFIVVAKTLLNNSVIYLDDNILNNFSSLFHRPAGLSYFLLGNYLGYDNFHYDLMMFSIFVISIFPFIVVSFINVKHIEILILFIIILNSSLFWYEWNLELIPKYISFFLASIYLKLLFKDTKSRSMGYFVIKNVLILTSLFVHHSAIFFLISGLLVKFLYSKKKIDLPAMIDFLSVSLSFLLTFYGWLYYATVFIRQFELSSYNVYFYNQELLSSTGNILVTKVSNLLQLFLPAFYLMPNTNLTEIFFLLARYSLLFVTGFMIFYSYSIKKFSKDSSFKFLLLGFLPLLFYWMFYLNSDYQYSQYMGAYFLLYPLSIPLILTSIFLYYYSVYIGKIKQITYIYLTVNFFNFIFLNLNYSISLGGTSYFFLYFGFFLLFNVMCITQVNLLIFQKSDISSR